MKRFVFTTFWLFMLNGAIARPAENEGNMGTLSDPECLLLDVLVELPIQQETFHKLSTTHAYVRRCIGINDENKVCVAKDQELNMEQWMVIKGNKGSDKDEYINVSWTSHKECGYQGRTCPIDEALACDRMRTTHYYDEVNCECTCIVQVDGENTCQMRATNVAPENRIIKLESGMDLITKELEIMKSKLHHLENAIPKAI